MQILQLCLILKRFKLNENKFLQKLVLVTSYITSTNWCYTIKDVHSYVEQVTEKKYIINLIK